VRIESHLFAQEFIAGVAAAHAEFVKVSCALMTAQRYASRIHAVAKRVFAMVTREFERRKQNA
jgi:hypothetical protein